MNALARRRTTRLKGYDYGQAGAYFVTLCTCNREYLLGEINNGTGVLNPLGKIVAECWGSIPAHFDDVDLDAFVIMPNHVHGVVVISVGATHASPLRKPGPKPHSLGAVVGSFKSAVTKRINEIRHTPGGPIWQRNYYEHIIRDDRDLTRIREYIAGNPARWTDDPYNPTASAHASSGAPPSKAGL